MDSTNSAHRRKNRLSLEKSPYLLQHQWNPVDWYPFGEEAVARARAEDKPIFLSIGYSTCHWCHVMERESFENEEIARLMNERFINVKLDREERPDLDQIYMQATIAMHGQGGWPLSVWLTPDLRPFYCGTYFPPVSRYGRPGFPEIARTLADLYRDRRDDVLAQAAECVRWLTPPTDSRAPDDRALDDLPGAAARAILRTFDPAWGGFGGAPKFPRPAVLDLLAHFESRSPDQDRRHAIATTLDMMWRGGLYDHVGGGFCRYSTDERWLVPHFEKMLYDNAQLIEAYLDGAALCGRPDFVDVALDVAAFVDREMSDPLGGFHSAQDADSEGEEGKFYTWTPSEISAVLRDDAARAARIFGVTEGGNFEGKNVLHWPAGVDETAKAEGESRESLLAFVARVRSALFRARAGRVRPSQDDKVLTSWNGLMIHALARLGAVTLRGDLVARARAAAEFVESRLVAPDGRLLRRFRDGDARFNASLDDHAFHAHGLLGLFEATGDPRYVTRARHWIGEALRLFTDEDGGGLYFAARSDDLVVRMKESHDGAIPSGNAVMALSCARLSALTHDDAWRERGRAIVRGIAGDVASVPHAAPLLWSAWIELSQPPRTITVSAAASDAVALRAVARAHESALPGTVVVPAFEAHRASLVALGILDPAAPPFPTRAVSVLCEDRACRPFP